MDALQNLFNRRSVRDFTAQPIEEEKLHRILEAGMSGPCCVNARDWSFIIVTDREKLLEMAGPIVFGLAIAGTETGGVLLIGILIAAAAVIFLVSLRFTRDKDETAA